MADEKQTKLSIIVRTVDKATAKIKAISDRLDKVTKPFRDFKEALSDLREKSGLDDVVDGFKGVGGAIASIVAKVAMVGGLVALATAGLLHLIDGFDELGDKAEHIGVSVDFLAQMRYAAERSGVAVEQLDHGLQGFSKNLGQARAGTGRMTAFLKKVSPELLKQLKAAEANEAAFDLMAGAMAKVEDPAKRAALAQAAFGDAELGALFARGPKGLKELRDRYAELAGPQGEAAEQAGKVDDSLKDLKAATDGVKAALVVGLAPALKIIVDQLRDWFKENRGRVAEFAAGLGKKIPDAFRALVGAVRTVIDTIRPFVDSATKLKIIAVAVAAVIVGPLISSIYALGVALLTTPVGWIVAGIAAIAAGAYLIIKNWDELSAFFVDLWDTITGKFGWARTLIKAILLPITGFPLFIMSAWGDITDFFSTLWDGITSIFQKAWEFIEPIVGKIVSAAEAVKDVASAVFGAADPMAASRWVIEHQGGGNDVTAQSRALAAGSRSTEAKVTVDFANAPRGTRVRTDPQSTADVDLSVGYQMLVGGL